MKEMASQSGKLAVVTGASSGSGLALAKQFVRHGFDVVIAAEDDRLKSATEQLEALGGSAVAVQVDLATAVGVEDLYDAIVVTGRHVDALALNAGVGVGGK